MKLIGKSLSFFIFIGFLVFNSPTFSYPKIGNLSGRIIYISIYNGREQLVTRTQLNPGERVTLSACDQFIVFGDTNPPTNLAKFSACDREIVINPDLKGQRVD
ncbi:hypothetical protein LFX25_03665 [Leptospira sp. FAT2]|uniref:hypothetical protein n=1 Tax=Leptospira sanjuanensis TaxID=2879643 RepID=UPI001EE95A23|nr:hypothetical protein [Leptospira sanjuanensis]MCG6192336.1 hypothetical protein [Leptospira sanjuanensis]